jgi:voltage-gated potassium channel Kch
MREMYVAHG